MKYNDYPENLPEVLVEKLNSEYSKSKKLQEEYQPQPISPEPAPAPSVEPAPAPSVEPAPLPTPDFPTPSPETNNIVESFQSLTANEVNSLVSNVVNGLAQLECLLKEYADRTSNAATRQRINNIICSIARTRCNFVDAFNLRDCPCPPSCFAQGTTRRRLREQIIDAFYCVLRNMITLFANFPTEFGIASALSNTLDDFYNFLTLPQVN